MNIQEVLDNDLCCGCGACVGVCPAKALTIDISTCHMPMLDHARCTQCGLCYKVCPGKGYPVKEMAHAQQAPFHKRYGPLTGMYRAHATTPEIRSAGASGGAATAILLFLLESNRVDCVVVPILKNNIIQYVITSDPATVVMSQGSKYVPVPIDSVIEEIRTRPRRFAMTCTPCQLAAWKAAESIIPSLKDCMVCSIGLFCGHVQSYEGIHCLARNMHVPYPQGATFCGWRCGSYPGNTRFQLQNGGFVDKPYYPSLDIFVPYFTLNRCFLCPEGGNWLSDITLGDIHSQGVDETVLVSRNDRSNLLINDAQAAGHLALQKESEDFASRTVIHSIVRAKTLPVLAVFETSQRLKTPIPDFDMPEMYDEYPKFIRMKRYWVMRYSLLRWAREKRLWKRLEAYPRTFERIGHMLYCFPGALPGWRLKERLRAYMFKFWTSFRK